MADAALAHDYSKEFEQNMDHTEKKIEALQKRLSSLDSAKNEANFEGKWKIYDLRGEAEMNRGPGGKH